MRDLCEKPEDAVMTEQIFSLTMRLATSPVRSPRWYTLPSAVLGKSEIAIIHSTFGRDKSVFRLFTGVCVSVLHECNEVTTGSYFSQFLTITFDGT